MKSISTEYVLTLDGVSNDLTAEGQKFWNSTGTEEL